MRSDHFHEVFNSLILRSNVDDHDHFKSVVRNEENVIGSCKALRFISTLLKVSVNGAGFELENDDIEYHIHTKYHLIQKKSYLV
jgi:hypothetical protein